MEREVQDVNELLISAMSLIGTLVGTFGGILVSRHLLNYRMGQMEQSVQRFSEFAERVPVLEEKILAANERIRDLEDKIERKEEFR